MAPIFVVRFTIWNRPTSGFAPMDVCFRPPFIGIYEVDKIFGIAVFFAMFAIGEIFLPAGFTVDIPVSVHCIVIFIVEEVFIALGTLFQVFIPALRTKVNVSWVHHF